MKVLFVALPGTGHIKPMLPLARAMQAAGHDAFFATGADFAPMAEKAGFKCASAGPTRAQALAERLARHPESVHVDPVDQQRFHVRHVWASIYTTWMLSDLLDLVPGAGIDLIVHDAMAFAGPLLSACTGIRTVSHSTGPAFARGLLNEAAEQLTELWRELGAERSPEAAGIYDTAHVDVWPAALQLADVGDRGAIIPIETTDDDIAGPEDVPGWLAGLPDRPLVHMTLGTVFNHNPAAFRAVLDALSGEDVTVLASVGPSQDPAVVGPVPANARVERWLPHGLVIPMCAAVICHGGAGTMLKSFRAGVPLLLLPQGADMFRTARACADYGIARSLAPDAVSPESVLTEFRKIMDDPAYRQRYEPLSAEMARLAPPRDVVPVLEVLAAAGR
jgi:UDP:flavonoid glycosyltransferase YjiC (YdhE family)